MEPRVKEKPDTQLSMLGSGEGNHRNRSQCEHGRGWHQSSACFVTVSERMSAGLIRQTQNLSSLLRVTLAQVYRASEVKSESPGRSQSMSTVQLMWLHVTYVCLSHQRPLYIPGIRVSD